VIRKRLLVLAVVMCGALSVSVASAAACTDSWTGTAGDGLWNTATNWSTGVIPQSSDDVCLPALGKSYTVTLSPSGGGGGYTVKSLTVGTASGSTTETLDIVGQSFVAGGETQNGESLGVSGGATINATGSLVLDATAGGTRAGSTDTLGGPAIFGGATTDNYGQIIGESSDTPTWGEQLGASVDNEPGGSITIASGSLDQETGNTVTNQGTVTTDAGAGYDVTSAGTNDVFTNDGTLADNGAFAVEGGSGTFTQEAPVTGNAVTIETGATLADEAGAGTFTIEYGTNVLSGTIPAGQTVNVRGASYIYQGETQNGTGLSLGGGTVTNDGTLTFDTTSDGTRMGSTDTLGGGVTVFDGTLANDGTVAFEVDDPTWPNTLNAEVTNAHAGTIAVAGGLNENENVAVSNDGTFTLTPSALYKLSEGGTFTNEADGTLAAQTASATSFGSFALQSPCCSGPGIVTARGTLTPQLVGGFTPLPGTEFELFSLQGGTFSGTFSTVGNGFTADYAHASASPAFVGVIYDAPTPPVAVSSTSEKFTAVVNPAGLATTAYFEYGLDPSEVESADEAHVASTVYDERTPAQQVGSDHANHTVTATVSGLQSDARYDYRLVTVNSKGTKDGPNVAFTTRQGPPPPPPVEGKSVDLAPVKGKVFIKLPRGRRFVRLTEGIQVPVGAVIDATNGKVSLESATTTKKHGKNQTADFYDGEFQVAQRRGAARTTLVLMGGAKCPKPGQAFVAGHRRPKRHLWGSGHGNFTTQGSYASASVLGTVWLTEDYCDGTLIHVSTDVVRVDDLVTHRTLLLRAGHSFFAAAKG
jgi:hypothetical protein